MQRVYEENEWGKVSKRIITFCDIVIESSVWVISMPTILVVSPRIVTSHVLCISDIV